MPSKYIRHQGTLEKAKRLAKATRMAAAVGKKKA